MGHPTEEQHEERQRKGSYWHAPAFFPPLMLHGLHAPHMPTVTMHTFSHLGRPAAVDEDREGSDIGVHVGLPDAGRLEVHARVRGLGEILGLRPLVRVSVRIALGSEATSSRPRQRGISQARQTCRATASGQTFHQWSQGARHRRSWERGWRRPGAPRRAQGLRRQKRMRPFASWTFWQSLDVVGSHTF